MLSEGEGRLACRRRRLETTNRISTDGIGRGQEQVLLFSCHCELSSHILHRSIQANHHLEVRFLLLAWVSSNLNNATIEIAGSLGRASYVIEPREDGARRRPGEMLQFLLLLIC